MNNLRIASIVSVAAISVALLSGCSAVAAVANAQSKTQACLAISSNLTGVGKALSNDTPAMATDPKGTAKKIAVIATKFSAAADKLSNAAVRKSAVDAAASLTTFSDDITSIANKPTTAAETKLQTDLGTLQTRFEKIDTACKA